MENFSIFENQNKHDLLLRVVKVTINDVEKIEHDKWFPFVLVWFERRE